MSDAKVVAGVSGVVDGADGVQRGRLTPPYPGADGVRFGWAVASTSGAALGNSTPASSSLWWLEAHVGLQLVGLLACPRDDLSARCHGTSVLKGAAYVLRDRATSTALGFLASAEPGMAAGARAVASYRRDGPGPLQGPVRHLTPSLPMPRAHGRPRPTRRHHPVTQAGGCKDDTAILGIGDTSSLSTRPWAAAPGGCLRGATEAGSRSRGRAPGRCGGRRGAARHR